MSESISVVISCYNHVSYVVQAVESALQQTLPPREVVVVDDGSTDGSYEVLRSFGDRIRLLTHPGRVNLGSAVSMNLGIAAASGELIAFLESDDYWFADKLRRQSELFRSDPDIGVVYTNGYAVNDAGVKIWDLFPAGFAEPNRPESLLLDCHISAGMSTVAVRRQLLEEVGGFEAQVRYAKDHDLWLRLIERKAFAYIPEPLMAYRRHPGQQSVRREHWDEGFKVLERAMARYPYPAWVHRKRLAVLHYRLAQHLWQSGSPLLAAGRIARAAALDPRRALVELVALLRGRRTD